MLTERQRQILDFLTKYVDAHGYPPTVREIGEAVGLASPSTVHAHLANLERAGLLKRDPTKPRALELRREPKAAPADVHKLPLVGEVAAGGPLLAAEAARETWRALEEFNLNASLALDALFVRIRRALQGVPAWS